jgi:hypothetical protein
MGKKSRLKREKKRKGVDSSIPELPDNTSSVFFDTQERLLLVFTDDMLINQLRRDCPQIATSFDALCHSDLVNLSRVFSKSCQVLAIGMRKRESKEFYRKTGMILMNAPSSFVAAALLVRNAFVLQPRILVRGIVEQVATALHLMAIPSELPRLDNGTFESTKAMSTADKMLPIFGRLYGFFSESFIHVGDLHTNLQPVKVFKIRHPPLEMNLQFLGMAALLLDMADELFVYDCVSTPCYFTKVSHDAYRFEPSGETIAFMDALMHNAVKALSWEPHTTTVASSS